MNAYKRPPISTEAQKAIERIVEHHLKLQELDQERRRQAAMRAGAVADALAQGASLREIAASLGMSPEAVRKMGMVDARGSAGADL